MLQSSITYIAIRTFPESIALILAGYMMLNLKDRKLEIIKKGIIHGLIISFVRLLPIHVGVHSIFAFLSLGILIYYKSNKSLIEVLISVCFVWMALSISELIYIMVTTKILNIPFDIIVDNTKTISALITLPSLLIFMLIIFTLKKFKNEIETKREE